MPVLLFLITLKVFPISFNQNLKYLIHSYLCVLKAEGIFRINPENSQEEYVRSQLNRGLLPLGIDVHCLAGLIKVLVLDILLAKLSKIVKRGYPVIELGIWKFSQNVEHSSFVFLLVSQK